MPAQQVSEAIELVGVTKSFNDGTNVSNVLLDIDLRVAPGEFVSVLGPSGAGKSTLLNVAAGILEPDRGTIRIAGKPVSEARTQKQIGLVPQTPALLPWRTVLENVELPLRVNRQASGGRLTHRPEELLQAFGLGSDMKKYPWQLSVGMRQRVNIARAFAFNPALLLMDEPFSALDEINREEQQLRLVKFWQTHRKSVLFVTHSVSEALLLSDRIVLMGISPGRIAEVVNVDLPRPRLRKTNETVAFRELESYVRERLRQLLRAGGAQNDSQDAENDPA